MRSTFLARTGRLGGLVISVAPLMKRCSAPGTGGAQAVVTLALGSGHQFFFGATGSISSAHRYYGAINYQACTCRSRTGTRGISSIGTFSATKFMRASNAITQQSKLVTALYYGENLPNEALLTPAHKSTQRRGEPQRTGFGLHQGWHLTGSQPQVLNSSSGVSHVAGSSGTVPLGLTADTDGTS